MINLTELVSSGKLNCLGKLLHSSKFLFLDVLQNFRVYSRLSSPNTFVKKKPIQIGGEKLEKIVILVTFPDSVK